jgi:hypothetical protein
MLGAAFARVDGGLWSVQYFNSRLEIGPVPTNIRHFQQNTQFN